MCMSNPIIYPGQLCGFQIEEAKAIHMAMYDLVFLMLTEEFLEFL